MRMLLSRMKSARRLRKRSSCFVSVCLWLGFSGLMLIFSLSISSSSLAAAAASAAAAAAAADRAPFVFFFFW